MGGPVKILSLLMWVTQFGVSVIFPTCFFLSLGVWLQNRFDLGVWIVIALGILGVMTSVSTAKACLRSLQKAADEVSNRKTPPIAFNDHN